MIWKKVWKGQYSQYLPKIYLLRFYDGFWNEIDQGFWFFEMLKGTFPSVRKCYNIMLIRHPVLHHLRSGFILPVFQISQVSKTPFLLKAVCHEMLSRSGPQSDIKGRSYCLAVYLVIGHIAILFQLGNAKGGWVF